MGNTKVVNGALVTEIPVDTSVTNDQLERQAHKYEVGRIKLFPGREGTGLDAVLIRDHKAIAGLHDDGNGGMMHIDFHDRKHGESAEEAMFQAFIAGVVPSEVVAKPGEEDRLFPSTRMQFAMERWINLEVERTETDRRYRRACKTKTLFQVGKEIGGEKVFQVKGVGADVRQWIEKKYQGQKIRILNDEYK